MDRKTNMKDLTANRTAALSCRLLAQIHSLRRTVLLLDLVAPSSDPNVVPLHRFGRERRRLCPFSDSCPNCKEFP